MKKALSTPTFANLVALAALIISGISYLQSSRVMHLQEEQFFEERRDIVLQKIKSQKDELIEIRDSFNAPLELAKSNTMLKEIPMIEDAIKTTQGGIDQLDQFYGSIKETDYTRELGVKYWYSVERELREQAAVMRVQKETPKIILEILKSRKEIQPNQSLETTTMAVTPAASHPSRQP